MWLLFDLEFNNNASSIDDIEFRGGAMWLRIAQCSFYNQYTESHMYAIIYAYPFI